jgi:hypothetical protein
MPVAETLELVDRLAHETDVHLAGVIVNRVLPELFGRGEEEVFHRLRRPTGVRALSSALATVSAPPTGASESAPAPDSSGDAVNALLDAALLAVTLRRTRAEHLTRLRTELGADVPLVYVPYLFARAHGVRATRALAEALAGEIDD